MSTRPKRKSPGSGSKAASKPAAPARKARKTGKKKGKKGQDTAKATTLFLRRIAPATAGDPSSTATYEAITEARRMEIDQSTRLAKRQAKAAAKQAKNEPANKAKCLSFMAAKRADEAPTDRSSLVRPLRQKASIAAVDTAAAAVGDFVDVVADLSPGMWRFGGKGIVRYVHGVGGGTTIDVQDVTDGRWSMGVPITAFTVLPPAEDYKLERRRAKPSGFSFVPPLLSVPPAPRLQGSLKDELLYAHRYRRTRGWRRRDLFGDGATAKRLTIEEKRACVTDYRELAAMLLVMKQLPEQQRYKGAVLKRDAGGTYAKVDRAGALTCDYLLTHAWGVGKNSGKTFPTQAR